MSDVMANMWQDVANAFQQRYDAIGDNWEAQTPCEKWNVRELVDHAVGVQKNFGGAVGLDAAEDADWPAVKEAMLAALANPENMAGTINHPAFGEVPKVRMLGIGISDLLIHSWDLGKAIDFDGELPADAVAAAYEGLQQLPPEVIRAEERFGAPIEVADDADMLTKLIAFAGRQP